MSARLEVIHAHGYWAVWDTSDDNFAACNCISPEFTTKEQAEAWLSDYRDASFLAYCDSFLGASQ